MNCRHARGESEYNYKAAYDIIYKYKFFPAGQPTAEAIGPRLRGLPLRVLFCWFEIAPRSWLRRFAPTTNIVAGCGVVLDPGGILQDPKTRSLLGPGFLASLRTGAFVAGPGQQPNPHPNSVGPSQVAPRASGIENRQVRTKSMLWGHINALVLNLVRKGTP